MWAGASLDSNRAVQDTQNGRYPAGFRADSAERMGGPAAADTSVPGVVDRNAPGAACKDDSDFEGVPAAAEAAGNAAPDGTAERAAGAAGVKSGAPGYAVPRQKTQAATALRARQPKPRGATSPLCVCLSSSPRPLLFNIPTRISKLSSGPRHPHPGSRRWIQADPAAAHYCPKSANRVPLRLHGRALPAAPNL
jgi:hypothetical protein